MFILNKRQLILLNTLRYTNDIIPIETISNQLNCSDKTIRNDINSINTITDEEIIVSIRNKGIFLKQNKTSFVDKILLQNKTSNNTIDDQLLYYLIFFDKITVNKLCTKLFTSQSNIYRIISRQKNTLKFYNIDLIINDYIHLECKSENEYRHFITNFSNMHMNSLSLSYDDAIIYFFKNSNLDKIKNIIKNAENKYHFRLNDINFYSLVFQVNLIIKRAKHPILVNKKTNIILNSISSYILTEINKYFNFEISEFEINYLSDIMRQYTDSFPLETVLSEKHSLLDEAMHELIKSMSKCCGTDFCNDNILLDMLKTHLSNLLCSDSIKSNEQNPFLQEIKFKYSNFYIASWYASILFQKYFNLTINEDEIGYIALFFISSYDRQIKNSKALVIWTTSIKGGILTLNKQILNKSLPSLEIVQELPLHQLSEFDINEYDFIISNEDTFQASKNIVKVNKIITEKDILLIKNEMNSLKNSHSINSNIIIDLIIPENIFFIENRPKCKNSAIKLLCDNLEKNNYVTSNYYESVIKRESITTTNIGSNIITPHGLEEYVKNSTISIMKLQDPIIDNNQLIDYIFLLSINLEELKLRSIDIDEFYLLLIKFSNRVANKNIDFDNKNELIAYLQSLL
ncbi:MAG: PTS sugar transporter subunit IIA [Anaerorhabdus sp.]|uniref:BglG family transcription antiterminator n=1 Tax=Anaerorhabdus sp. TaxID=1872524 RepID=UPI002FCAE570